MGLKAIEENLDAVDSKYHDLYEERQGKFYIKQIDGLKTDADVERVQTALTNEKKEHKTAKEALAKLGTVKPEEVAGKLTRLAELETVVASGADEAKVKALVDQGVLKETAKLNAQIDTLKSERDTLATENGTYKAKSRQRTIADEVTSIIGSTTGFRKHATEDALLLAESVLVVDDSGDVVVKDGHANAGLDAKGWFKTIAEKRPHWFEESQSGNARSPNGKPGSGNPWSHANWNVTEQGRVYNENKDRAAALAKAAGTSVGGGRPAAK